MKKNLKKVISFILSMLVIISTAFTPAMAAGTKDAPTEVKSVTNGGLWSPVLNLEFTDTTWMDQISKVIVNDKECKKGTINSFSSDTNVWEVGSVTGAYGSYKALKLAVPDGKLWTVKISADGYKDLTVKITKETVNYSDVYTATVVSDSNEPAKGTYTAAAATAVNGKVTLSSEKDLKEGDTVTVTAVPDENYEVEAVTVKGASGKSVDVQPGAEGTYTFKMPAENVTVSATFKAKQPEADKQITIDQVSIGTDMFGSDWEMSFKNAEGYVNAVTEVKVNGTTWEEKSYGVSSGGAYKKDTYNNKLVFAAKDYSPSPVIPVLKSGDVITISAKGYEDLTMKLVIDASGNASLVEDDGQGDPYDLHVKIEGSFEAAIVGQKDYDGVSSASVGGANSNKNSSVKVYGALVNKGTDPADSDWEELDNLSQIKLDGPKCKVDIVPDVENGTPADSDSGMEGVYMTVSSDLTLNGTPKDPGTYLISVSITDDQGRTAVSNTLPFKIYKGDEKLADRLKEENFKQYESGLYAWDIMEPWVIEQFGSNVDGEEESVRVPKDLEAWFGSHTSGTYGYLGYDIPWKKVVSGDIPETLYIPAGCNLTLTNMEVLSSVRIVVENGGKLTLSDSVVQGIIDVKSGGTFSMNYDSYGQTFTTGASLCGQLRLADGAILENAAIYSHANYLANGDLVDRNTTEPVVTATGNVTIRGKVFIEGDEAGSDIGQTALRVAGNLNLEDGAELVAYGGGGNVMIYAEGGAAIDLVNGSKITGNGKVTAIGGDVLWGNGGTAVTGNGTIETTEAFIQGATANDSNKAEAGKALASGVTVTSPKRHVQDGTMISGAENDPLEELYWKSGINPTPPLDKFTTQEVENVLSAEDVADKTYDGTPFGGLVVKAGDAVLTEGSDYTLTYKDAEGNELPEAPVNAGTYTVTVNGLGMYGGMNLVKTFTITPKNAELTIVTDPSSAKYDGKSQTPEVVVKDGDSVLAEGTDYTLSYVYGDSADAEDFAGAEFIEAGNYTIIVTGTGNYAGSTGTTAFTISKDDSASDDPVNPADPSNPSKPSDSTDDKKGIDTTQKTDNTGNKNNSGSAANTATAKNNAAKNNQSSVKTGDEANALLWLMLAVIACGALAGTTIAVRRRR